MGCVCLSTMLCSALTGKCEMFLQNISALNGKKKIADFLKTKI